MSVLPDGGRASSCSDCAYYIRELEPNTAIYGFWSKDNPSWAGAKLQDGHDFAIVEGRYIVDPWIKETASEGQNDPILRHRRIELLGA